MIVKDINLSDIKLVIWDLDDTFWEGTLSEGEITPINENIELIKNLADIGIINSVNSKNNLNDVEKKLLELGVRDYFVFLSVNWSAKGQRIKDQIEAMQLRAPNVLFIDDNHLNIEEVRYFNPSIITETPENLHSLYEAAKVAEKKDKKHKRLKQYQLLETKFVEKSQFSSNEEFLYNSRIKVTISNDCINELDRIHDMIIRTNQLNYTKKRSSKLELKEILLDSSFNCGYISVSDRFGGYGIVGFYAIKDMKFEHFLFSCRTLGMGIEQYVYSVLNYPVIEVNGEVISELKQNYVPGWINSNTIENELELDTKFSANEAKVLFKGPCDLEQIFSYIEETNGIDCEFTYTNQRGISIEQHNHTYHVVEAITMEEEQKLKLINELPFSDSNMFSDKIYRGNHNIVFLSMLTDGNLGVYRRKESGEKVAFGEYYYPLTDQRNWDGYINGTIFNANCKFSLEDLTEFSRKYEFLGRISVNQTIENLKIIRGKLNQNTLLVLMIGVEIPYEDNNNPSYSVRHIIHQDMNDAIRKFAKSTENVKIIDFNNYISGQESFYNNINHFIKPVYYDIAKDIIKIINSNTDIEARQETMLKLRYDYLKQKVKKLIKK
jgi:FkbH-like protein